MRIVQVIRDCFDTMPNLKAFINEPRHTSNVLTDNSPTPFLLLDRPIQMPYRFVANNVEEVYDFSLVYGVVNSNTEMTNSQNNHDIEIDLMRIEAKRMILNLDKHPLVKSVVVTSPLIDFINGMKTLDVSASGIFQSLRITLLPMSPDVCATYPPAPEP
jgi:hypothetical protein